MGFIRGCRAGHALLEVIGQLQQIQVLCVHFMACRRLRAAIVTHRWKGMVGLQLIDNHPRLDLVFGQRVAVERQRQLEWQFKRTVAVWQVDIGHAQLVGIKDLGDAQDRHGHFQPAWVVMKMKGPGCHLVLVNDIGVQGASHDLDASILQVLRVGPCQEHALVDSFAEQHHPLAKPGIAVDRDQRGRPQQRPIVRYGG